MVSGYDEQLVSVMVCAGLEVGGLVTGSCGKVKAGIVKGEVGQLKLPSVAIWIKPRFTFGVIGEKKANVPYTLSMYTLYVEGPV